jgi:2-C-methyl-D-erythritol 4-phosphate cytidylyltransferase
LGRDLPKALVPIDGVPLVRWAASALASVTDRIVVTAPADAIHDFVAALDGVAARVTVVPGGPRRQESVAVGLAELADMSDDDAVLVHDAARPFMPVAVFGRLLEAIEHHDAAIPVLPVVDTIVSGVGGEVVYLDRGRLGAVQTPQAFRIGAVRDAHRRAAVDGILATDDASLVLHYGYKLATVEGDPLGRKITYPEDVEAFERRMSSR